ncbi:MAG: FxsA family protein [Pseudomonadota bacterium]
MWLFVAFLAVPLIEIGLFIEVGGFIGLWPTLGIVVLTAVIGTLLVRQQGFAAIGNLQRSLNEFDDPTEPLAHGAMILISAALLLTPGFFTDAVGFALLIPGIRQVVIARVRKRVIIHRANQQGPQRPRDTIIEGEFRDVGQDTPEQPGSSGWTRH